ncbi:MAG: FAD:protein FMN transferase [Magnetococcales bacterium]|nr:FAD:protein FMN transferase [Magnetococcales bacterium]
MKRPFWLLLLCVVLLNGCDSTPEPTDNTTDTTISSEPYSNIAPTSITRLVMGTLVTITIWNESDIDQPTVAAREQAVVNAFAEIQRVDAALSRHQPKSEVSHINTLARGEFHPISDELAELMAQALAITDQSENTFDAGLLPLITLWGFSQEPPPTLPPQADEIAFWLKQRPTPGIILQKKPKADAIGHEIKLVNLAVGLDLGGIAKGYAIDRATETLQAEGIQNALINAGGDLRVLGSKGARPWKIGIQHPRSPSRVIAVSNLVGPRAMVTSGDYERVFFHQDIRYHHILDPSTGEPSRSDVISVSVQADNATLADALSTTLFVMGLEKGLALLEHYENVDALFIHEDASYYQTKGFKAQWMGPPTSE